MQPIPKKPRLTTDECIDPFKKPAPTRIRIADLRGRKLAYVEPFKKSPNVEPEKK